MAIAFDEKFNRLADYLGAVHMKQALARVRVALDRRLRPTNDDLKEFLDSL